MRRRSRQNSSKAASEGTMTNRPLYRSTRMLIPCFSRVGQEKLKHEWP